MMRTKVLLAIIVLWVTGYMGCDALADINKRAVIKSLRNDVARMETQLKALKLRFEFMELEYKLRFKIKEKKNDK